MSTDDQPERPSHVMDHSTSVQFDFFASGYTPVCSCGWAGDECADMVGAIAACAWHVRSEQAVDAVMETWEES